MLKKNLFLAVALAFAVLLLSSMETKAQVSAQNVLKRTSAIIEKIESQNAQVLFVQIDNIKKDQISTQTYTLNAGSTYAVIAVGDDERIQDIDMVVVDSSDNEAGKDTDDSNVAIAKIKPKQTQSFKIGVKGFKMNRSDGFFALIICRLD